MGDLINLRRQRKARAKADADAIALRNRAVFGQSKVAKATGALERSLAERRLDAHARDKRPDPSARHDGDDA